MATKKLENTTLITEGKHTVTLKLYPRSKTFEDTYELQFREGDTEIEVLLFPGYIARFMVGIVKQSGGALNFQSKLSEVMDYCQHHEFNIWTSYSDKGYLQASYFPPKA